MKEYTNKDISFRISQIFEFLRAKGRSNVCPLCQHAKGWDFHIEPSETEDDSDPFVMIVHSSIVQTPDYSLPYFVMECPQCAYLVFTNLQAVKSHFDQKGN